MNTLVLAPTRSGSVEGDSTLDEVLVSVWEGLAAQRSVECPMCGGEMDPDHGAHALPVGGRCASCGATLR